MNGRLLYTLPVLAALLWFAAATAQNQVAAPPREALAPDSSAAAQAKALAAKIDAILTKKWKGTKVKSAPLANDTEFFRRLTLDLTGQIPSLLEIRDFLDDDSPDKRSQWTEKMLDGDRYPVHFSYVWRSIMLTTRSEGNLVNARMLFEKWLQDRLQANMKYDQIAKEMVTLFKKPGEPGSPNAFNAFNGTKPEEQTGSVARVFLGVKIECAQCHPHPFADWTKQQFWEFAAFFEPKSVKGGPNGYQRPEILIPGTKKTVKAKFLDGTEPPEATPEQPRFVLANWIATKQNPFFARATADHLWAQFFGVSLLEPLLETQNAKEKEKEKGKDKDKEKEQSVITHPELLNLLTSELIAHDFDLKHLIRAIVYTEAYQRTSKSKSKDEEQLALFARMPIRALTADQLFDSFMVATNSKVEAQSYQPVPQFNPGGAMYSERNQFLLKWADTAKPIDASTSILQALHLMNSKFINDRIDPKNNSVLPVLANTNAGTKRQLETLFLMVLTRPPSAKELATLAPYVDSGGPTGDRAQAFADVMWALLNSSEFAVNH
jgi:hypothetical protein